jgi:hypothetical protein
MKREIKVLEIFYIVYMLHIKLTVYVGGVLHDTNNGHIRLYLPSPWISAVFNKLLRKGL